MDTKVRELLQIPGITRLVCFPGINSSPPGQNCRLFADDNFMCIFVTEKFCILIKSSLQFVPRGSIDNKPAMILIMAWRLFGTIPSSEPMMVY